MTYKRQSNCTVTCEVQTRPDVKNPERSERTSRPENQRSIGWRELNRIEKLLQSEEVGRLIVLDLQELTLVDQEAVRFLEECDSNGVELQNCPPYIGEWMERQRDGK